MYTEQERNQMVAQYEPLVNKLVAQFHHKVHCEWSLIKSMAYEGLVLAMNKYDPERSTMSFMSFAAFEIRNNIMTRLTEESRTVKLPFEEQKRLKEKGISTYNSISIDQPYSGDEDVRPRETLMNMTTPASFENGDVYEYFYHRLESQFGKRDCEMFYMTFGLNGYKETPNQKIARHFKVSEGLVSQKKKKIIEFIRQDTDLCEMLSSLL